MQIDGFALYAYTLPYRREVRWFRSVETEGDFVVLRLSSNGAVGIAEAPVKPTWSGLSARALEAIISDIYIPALGNVDVSDAALVRETLALFPGNELAKMLVQNACLALSANAAQLPLWRYVGGSREVELSWCITRQPPRNMAAEAASVVAEHGFRTLKVKGGQGFDVDREVLRAIRKEVDDAVSLTVDANSAYDRAEVRDYISMLVDQGVSIAEDPCMLTADPGLADLVASSPIPVLVDMPCTSLDSALSLMQAGARALSIKPGRIGITEASAMRDAVTERGFEMCSGMYAESLLGTQISLAFSSTIAQPFLPAEQTFFKIMQRQVIDMTPKIADGRITQSDEVDPGSRVDWKSVTRIS